MKKRLVKEESKRFFPSNSPRAIAIGLFLYLPYLPRYRSKPQVTVHMTAYPLGISSGDGFSGRRLKQPCKSFCAISYGQLEPYPVSAGQGSDRALPVHAPDN